MTADEAFVALKHYSKEYGKFPTIREFSEHLKLPYGVVSKVYDRWILQGKLTRQGNSYNFSNEEERVAKPDNVLIVPKKRKADPKPQTNPVVQKLLDVTVAVIGISLILCSVHFTFSFNKMSMHELWAFLLSFSIVAFMSIAFAVSSSLKKRTLKSFVMLLWVLGFLYSVFTAVSGQYNDFRSYVSNDKSIVVEGKKKAVKEQLAVLNKKQKELLHWRERESEYTFNPNLKRENPGTWKTIQDGVRKLEEVESKIEALESQNMQLIEVDVTSEETVFSWLCRILGISSDTLHLAIIVFPSVFIDLCSGICFLYVFSRKWVSES